MNLFRSEEHIERWLAGRGPGATLPVGRLGELAHAWWHDRLAPDLRPRTREENPRTLDGLGLSDPFWRLP
jgi:hypothetical protein